MKVTVSIDSFKGSLTTLEAGRAIARGIQRAFPRCEVKIVPLADGGEGTADAVTAALQGEICETSVTAPLGGRVTARYGWIPEKKLAVMEMSSAAGITLVPREKLDPRRATTYGVGEMILDAIRRGAETILMGIGGSATNDGGAGMLSALGVSFTDAAGSPIPEGAEGLEKLSRISLSDLDPRVKSTRFLVACDVNNPLCGENGCSAVYGPQKGADEDAVRQMDAWLSHYGSLTKGLLPHADPEAPGAGAAGGLGFAFLSYLKGELSPGVVLVSQTVGLEAALEGADLVITGEGRLDRQSAMGKAPTGVAALAKKHGIPVVALAGTVNPDASVCHEGGIDAFFPILQKPCTLEEAMDRETAEENLSRTAEQVARLFFCGK